MKKWLLTSCLLLMACGALPRDPEGSYQSITRNHVMRIGVVAPESDFGRRPAALLLNRLSQVTGARPRIVTGATEPLFQALERGDLDLVLTPLDPKTPWAAQVALSPAIAARGEGERRMQYHAAMRNGENRWIMEVEAAARDVAEPGAAS
jgi:hypothetical protein